MNCNPTKPNLWENLNDHQTQSLSGGVNKGELVDKVAEKAGIVSKIEQQTKEGKVRGPLFWFL